MPTDCPAITEPLSISPSITARRKRAGPEMLDLELGGGLVQLAILEFLQHLGLVAHETLGALIDQPAHGDDGEALVDLHGRHGIARVGADEGFLEILMRDALGRGREQRAKLRAGRTHFQIAQNCLAAAQARPPRRPAPR